MNMQAKVAVSFLGLCALSSAGASDFEDYARVVDVRPQVEQVNQPRQECHTEYVTVQRQRGVGGSVLGGVAGGILGNQVGGGNGRMAATAAGAIIGAIAGDRVQNSHDGGSLEQQPVERCHTVDHWQTRNNGYAVTYEYRGHTYDTVLPYDPGQRLQVNVAVTPSNY